MVWEE